jgi:hypothetical protein
LHLLKAGQAARMTPASYPDLKLACQVTEVNPVRLPTGNFLALVTLRGARRGCGRP